MLILISQKNLPCHPTFKIPSLQACCHGKIPPLHTCCHGKIPPLHACSYGKIPPPHACSHDKIPPLHACCHGKIPPLCAGTKVKLKKPLLEHAKMMQEKTQKLRIPKNIGSKEEKQLKLKRRKAGTSIHCDYLQVKQKRVHTLWLCTGKIQTCPYTATVCR